MTRRGLLAALLVLTAIHAAWAGEVVPRQALAWRSLIVRQARAEFGLEAPSALFAAQLHQESAWRPEAVSRVGAQGMAQFMPGTSAWLAEVEPGLAPAAPFSPSWAIRAMVRYDRRLWLALADVPRFRERWAMTLSAYNGGLAWVRRDRIAARKSGLDATLWFDQVETVNAGRSPANHRENRRYPRRILLELTPLYAAAGFGPDPQDKDGAR